MSAVTAVSKPPAAFDVRRIRQDFPILQELVYGTVRWQATLDWLSDHGAAFVSVDAPPGDHFTIMPRIDAVTRDDLAYMRLHGRNTDGYLAGADFSSFSAKMDQIALDSGSGLQGNGAGAALSLRRTCFHGNVLKWNLANQAWECAADENVRPRHARVERRGRSAPR